MNGAVLKAEDIDHGADAEEPYHLNYEGYIFTGWNKSAKNITSDMVITAVYVPDSGYTVGVEDGTGFINEPKDIYSFGDVVSVSAYPEKDGMEFTGWYSGDNLVSTELNYSFYVVADTWLTAKYEGKADVTIILNFEMGDREIADTSQTVSMLMKWNFPDDYSIISTGLIRTYDDQKAENLTLEIADGTTVKQAEFGLTDSVGTFIYTVTMGPNSKVKTLWSRGYVIYKL